MHTIFFVILTNSYNYTCAHVNQLLNFLYHTERHLGAAGPISIRMWSDTGIICCRKSEWIFPVLPCTHNVCGWRYDINFQSACSKSLCCYNNSWYCSTYFYMWIAHVAV